MSCTCLTNPRLMETSKFVPIGGSPGTPFGTLCDQPLLPLLCRFCCRLAAATPWEERATPDRRLLLQQERHSLKQCRQIRGTLRSRRGDNVADPIPMPTQRDAECLDLLG